MRQLRRFVLLSVFLVASTLTVSTQQPPAAAKPESWGALRFRHVGPQGNRTVAVTGVPGDPNVAYAGAASGGGRR